MTKLGRPRKYDGSETKITVRVNEEQRKRLRHYAAIDDTSMTEIVHKALQQYINRRKAYFKRGVEMEKND